MPEVMKDVNALRKAGAYRNKEEFMEEAFRALLEKRPELRIELAVEKYKSEKVSLNKAVEIAGVSPEEFKEILKERGIKRKAGFLSEKERKERLKNL